MSGAVLLGLTQLQPEPRRVLVVVSHMIWYIIIYMSETQPKSLSGNMDPQNYLLS